MKINREKIRSVTLCSLLALLFGGCTKVGVSSLRNSASGLTNQNDSNFECSSTMHYVFKIPSGTNLLQNFQVTSVGGTSSVLSSSCTGVVSGVNATLVPEHSVSRTGNQIKIMVGTEVFAQLNTDLPQGGSVVANGCKAGQPVQRTLQDASVDSAASEIRIKVESGFASGVCI